MYCHQLTVEGFRNLSPQTLQLSPGRNVFLGQNGQGKTNTLEALWLLSRGRSHRTRQDKEWITFGHHQVSVNGVFHPDTPVETAGDPTLTIQYQQIIHPDSMRSQSRWQANGVNLTSKSKLVGRIPTVGFFHPDLALLRGAPSHRRDWLDGAMCQVKPSLVGILQQFETHRKQKTELLKSIRFPVTDSYREQLAVWNEGFVQAAAQVIVARMAYLQAIAPWAKIQYCRLAQQKETLSVGMHWASDQQFWCGSMDEEMVEQRVEFVQQVLRTAIQQRQNEEIARQQCVVGPHRDTLLFSVDDNDAVAFASQGQQRSIVLALKLAELEQWRQVRQTAPILILDDVLAELDQARQSYLLTQLDAQSQVWMTTTHIDESGPLADWLDGSMACFDVLQGEVTQRHSTFLLKANAALALER